MLFSFFFFFFVVLSCVYINDHKGKKNNLTIVIQYQKQGTLGVT
jgi:hypothetical protein